MKELSARTLRILTEIHPDLAAVCRRAELYIEGQSFSGFELICGLRSKADAQANAKAGTGIAKSKHLAQQDGKSHAFDFIPDVSDPFPQPNDSAAVKAAKISRFRTLIGVFLKAADELGVIVRSGADWNGNGVETPKDAMERGNIADYPHIELVRPTETRYADCVKAAERRRELRANGEPWPI
jgi:hypothetical protein